MKNSSLIICAVLLAGQLVSGQQKDLQFFEPNGTINHTGSLTNDMGYTLTGLDVAADDVVWAHVVYSIIDLRDNRNSQLAFPTDQDVNYRNLFKLMSDAIVGLAPVYYPNESGISPLFNQSNIVPTKKLSDVFFIETDVAGAQYIDPLFEVDSVRNTVKISNRIYDRFSKRVNKFLIQKVYYFDKHLSQFSSKVIGIAPLMAADNMTSLFPGEDDQENNDNSTQTIKTTLRESILCWVLYDDLKTIFSTQPVYQVSNDAQRVSYHEFFSKKMFSDYIIGDNNLMKRWYGNTQEITTQQLTREIQDIQRKLIEIESGIWER
jgi:gliding motility associated protien GldN